MIQTLFMMGTAVGSILKFKEFKEFEMTFNMVESPQIFNTLVYISTFWTQAIFVFYIGALIYVVVSNYSSNENSNGG